MGLSTSEMFTAFRRPKRGGALLWPREKVRAFRLSTVDCK